MFLEFPSVLALEQFSSLLKIQSASLIQGKAMGNHFVEKFSQKNYNALIIQSFCFFSFNIDDDFLHCNQLSYWWIQFTKPFCFMYTKAHGVHTYNHRKSSVA